MGRCLRFQPGEKSRALRSSIFWSASSARQQHHESVIFATSNGTFRRRPHSCMPSSASAANHDSHIPIGESSPRCDRWPSYCNVGEPLPDQHENVTAVLQTEFGRCIDWSYNTRHIVQADHALPVDRHEHAMAYMVPRSPYRPCADRPHVPRRDQPHRDTAVPGLLVKLCGNGRDLP